MLEEPAEIRIFVGHRILTECRCAVSLSCQLLQGLPVQPENKNNYDLHYLDHSLKKDALGPKWQIKAPNGEKRL